MLSKTEIFDPQKLQTIIDEFDEFGIDISVKTQITKYINRSINGKIVVDYLQKRNQGRFNAVGSLSLQNIERSIRHSISSEYYTDVDMVNAHPVILSYLCKQNGFDTPYLDSYISDRENILSQVDASRENAKRQYLIMTNSDGSDIEPSTTHQIKYYLEMQDLHNRFSKLDSKAYKEHVARKINQGRDKNHKASYMNTLLCDMENRILMCMLEYFGNPDDCVLCFDGIMVRKTLDIDIEGCMNHIKKQIGIDMELKVKPMDEGIDLSKYVLSKAPIVHNNKFYPDVANLHGKTVYREHVDEWINNSIAVIDNFGVTNYALRYKTSSRMVKASDFEKTMGSMTCKIINPQYDSEYARSNPKSKDIRSKPFIATNLGFSKDGYLKQRVMDGDITKYYNIDYYPHLKCNEPKIDKNTYNMFVGFPYDDGINKTNNKFERSKLYKHLKEMFFHNNMNQLNHFLDSIADMIQDPVTIKDTAYLFYSPQGCGKGLFAKFMRSLLGRENTIKFENSDLYFESRFNADCQNKILKIFEEVSEKGSAFKNHNRLKAEISMDEERIESKGINPTSVRHCARYWFFTNNKNALYIENDDRRMNMVEISSDHANDKSYFSPIAKEINDESFIKEAFNYFANRKYSTDTVREVIESKYKTDQKMANVPSGIKFIIEYIQSTYDKIDDKDNKISSTKLRDAYSAYCSVNGIKYHMSTMETQIDKIGISKPRILRINGVRKSTYIINPKKIEDSIALYLKSQFKFDFGADC
jgi:hypothetical protein